MDDPKALGACDTCHALKVRCVIDDRVRDPTCSRCARLGRQCAFTARQRKKQKRRTDTRVTQLEKELAEIRSRLSDGVHSPTTAPTSEQAPQQERENASSTQPDQFECLPLGLSQNRSQNRFLDDGSISPEYAEYLMHVYISECCPLYPAVQIDPTVSLELLKTSRPYLLRAVLAAAALKCDPDLALHLQSENNQTYANVFITDMPKTLDLVQAILVSVLWCCPPKNSLNNRKFYELSNLAISIALEIGLDSKHGGSPGGAGKDVPGANLERERTFLGCYILSLGFVETTICRLEIVNLTAWLVGFR